ncbi:MAG: carboxypeptidase-like regulatory domain-containing protein [Nitrospiria bacterium]
MRSVLRTGMIVLIFFAGAMEASAAYEGRVVDAETKEPVAGVVVLMEWSTLEFNLMPHNHVFAEAHETLTDEEGRFSLPRYWSFNPWKLLFTDNILTIFKSGYAPITGGAWWTLLEYEWGADKGKFIWKIEDGKPVLLLKKASDREQRLRNMRRVRRSPTKEDLMTKEINKEREFFGFEPFTIETLTTE